MEEKLKIVQKRIGRKKILQLTDRAVGAVTDLVLVSLYLPFASLGKRPNSRDVYRTFEEAGEVLSCFNYKTIKKALYNLCQEGFVENLKRWEREPLITESGRKRIESLLPEYQETRPWDGKLYLINYDVSNKQNHLRNRLRDFLRRLGSIKLQRSLYVVANDPYGLVSEFQEENELEGAILVSELGKRSFVGNEDLKAFIWGAAGLSLLNNRYRSFIEKWRAIKNKFSKIQMAVEYYSVLKVDPQLPFELLPDEYLGDEAYLLFQKLLKKVL